MLSVFSLWASARQMGVVNANMLLQMLKGVVRSLGQSFESRVLHVVGRHMPIRQESRGRERMVRGESMKRVGQHCDFARA